MVAQPSSVPAVRRFVDDALTGWGRTDLVDDVGLSVTELATNATLHSDGSFFDVELRAEPDAVRLSVVDRGSMPTRAVASRGELAVLPVEMRDAESMTGRGLFIVSALAARWGIDDLPGGTRVWADFAPETVEYEPSAPEVRGTDQTLDDAPVQVIELVGCPPDLLLAHDDNLADIARELRLFGATHDDPTAVRSAERIVEIVRVSALSWDAARLVARHAVHDGRPRVDVAIASSDPDDMPRKVQVLRDAVGTAERMMARGLLMTMPAPEPVQRWRDWVEGELVEQATTGRPPLSYADWEASR